MTGWEYTFIDAAILNSLHPSTASQGNDYGWGFLSFGFGLPFGFVTMSEWDSGLNRAPGACGVT